MMKKIGKRLILTALLLSLLVSATGCTMLTDLRQHHGKTTKKGTIVVEEAEYILLPPCEYISMESFEDVETLHVTNDDVPLLLCGFLGTDCHISDDKTIIMKDADAFYDEEYSLEYFCREDQYEKVTEAMKNGYQPDVYQSYYYDFLHDEEKTYTYTKDEVALLQKALKAKPIPTIDGEYNYVVDVQSRMKGLPFGQYEFSIEEVSGTYYLETEDGYYRLPEELLGTLKEIQKETSLSEEW